MRPYKGMRTFPPTKHGQLARILGAWKECAQRYGFEQYKTPVLDPIEIYQGKTSEEIISEQTYNFTDRGGRSVLLRPEITPGLCSMVVDMQKEGVLRNPTKLFSIGSVFRYEKPQRGRTREHIQFNADIFGDNGVWAESEVITVACDILTSLGMSPESFTVHISDRDHVHKTLKVLGVENVLEVMRLLDRRKKMSQSTFSNELRKNTSTPINEIDEALKETPTRVKEVLKLIPKGINAQYDPSIVRGFDYYTGIVFEIFAQNKNTPSRSLVGGGRYDTLISSYGGKQLPAVGFGMGDVTISDCIFESEEDSNYSLQTTLALVALHEDAVPHAIATAQTLRKKYDVSFIGTCPEKKQIALFKRLEKNGFRFVVVVNGKQDFMIRNLETRTTKASRDIKNLTSDIAKVLKI